MSALTKLSGSRVQSVPKGDGYGDLRDKFSSLLRSDKAFISTVHHTPARPSAEEKAMPTPVTRQERSDTQERDLGSAFDILSRATSCFDLLTQKVDQLEEERDEAISCIEQQKRSMTTLQEVNEVLQAKLRNSERELAEMRRELAVRDDRIKACDEHAAQVEGTLKARERRIGDLEKIYTNLHDQVMTSFGNGSATFRALETLVDKFQKAA